MKTVGQFLKEKRVTSGVSISKLSKETKIRKSYIRSIEKMQWRELPEYPVVVGFVKSMAGSLGINKEAAVALLRRDYPPKRLPINPKPDVSENFSLTPRLAFITGTVLILLFIVSYLVYQYISFNSPPDLVVQSPTDNMVVTESLLNVQGRTEPDTTLQVNDQPVLVGDNGEFKAEIEISEETQTIEFVSVSRAGKETIQRRTIINKIGEE